MAKSLDHIDSAIIGWLNKDARSSLSEVGKHVGISGPAVGERLRRLMHSGVITGFNSTIDLQALGYVLQALVRIKPRSGHMKTVEKMILGQPRFLWCDRVTGEDCYIAKLALMDVAELDDLLTQLHDYAETHTSIVKSSLIENRLPPVLARRA